MQRLTEAIARAHPAGRTLVVGVQGGQGTGKTTLARATVAELAHAGLSAVAFSLDDFYAGADVRAALAETLAGNPYYRIPRGMPGTHRIELLGDVLTRLKAGEDAELPVFDKSAREGYGDVAPGSVRVRGRKDVVLFEGWCVGMPSATPAEVEAICRRRGLLAWAALPAPEHVQAVLDRVAAYQPLWSLLDLVVSLRPESPALIERWRLAQEHELIAATGRGLTDEQVRELVRRFLPFTLLCDETVRADIVVEVDRDHEGRIVRGAPPGRTGTTIADVRLRDVEDADLPVLYEHQRDPDSVRMADVPPRDWEAFAAHWATIRADATVRAKAIVADGKLAGNVVAWNQDGRRHVGYWIGRRHWGRGIASRALAMFLRSEAPRPLYALVARHNAASLRVLIKCGFTVREERADEYVLALEDPCRERATSPG